MPAVGRVLETAIYVDDMPRAVEFYKSIFGFQAMACTERFCAFDVAGRQVLLLFKRGSSLGTTPTTGGVIPPHDGRGPLHFAFSIAASELEKWEKWLASKGISIESRVRWELGGQSIYFRDPDNNLVELATPGTWPIY